MASGSKKIIYAALIGNSLISVTNYFAAAYTVSSAMLSERIHSLVDTGNQWLLLYGLSRTKKSADKKHPFGYGAALHFWTFIVAILIFAVGSGISMYESIHKLNHPEPITSPKVNYIVIKLAMIFEAYAFVVALKEFNAVKGDLSNLVAIRKSKNPALFTVLLEDAAATAGLIVAFVGTLCAQLFGLLRLDGSTSILIVLILAGFVILLTTETKKLLVGESVPPEIVESIRKIVSDSAALNSVNELRNLQLIPEEVLLSISFDFKDDQTLNDIESAVFMMEKTVKEKFPLVKRFLRASSTMIWCCNHLGNCLDSWLRVWGVPDV